MNATLLTKKSSMCVWKAIYYLDQNARWLLGWGVREEWVRRGGQGREGRGTLINATLLVGVACSKKGNAVYIIRGGLD